MESPASTARAARQEPLRRAGETRSAAASPDGGRRGTQV